MSQGSITLEAEEVASLLERLKDPANNEVVIAWVKRCQEVSVKFYNQDDKAAPVMNEEVIAAAKDVGLTRIYSCCDVPLKFCSSDIWRGDLAGFARVLNGRKKAQ